MYNNYNYPAGSDTPEAPWNQEELPDKEIEVTISVTLSKTQKITVNDYIVDDDGDYDFSQCNLKSAVQEQVKLPQEQYKDWTVDEFEIIEE